jgi:CBS domain-containing protein
MYTCSGDRPLSEALQVMDSEGVTSLVVVDNHMNVIGNISTTDVKVCRAKTPKDTSADCCYSS